MAQTGVFSGFLDTTLLIADFETSNDFAGK
jgi:hypothetical protein